jgi:hypothetical protein
MKLPPESHKNKERAVKNYLDYLPIFFKEVASEKIFESLITLLII